MNVIRKVNLLIVAVLTGWVEADDWSGILMYDNASPSNIVAAVVGYKETRRHPSGIDIPYFSVAGDAGKGKETGILFCIVAPTNYAGMLFHLTCPRTGDIWNDQPVPASFEYPTDELFQFKIGGHVQEILETTGRVPCFTTWHLVGTPYFWRYEDAVAFADTNKLKLAENKKALPELKKKWEDEKKHELPTGMKSRSYLESFERFSETFKDVGHREAIIRETEAQIERLKKMKNLLKATTTE